MSDNHTAGDQSWGRRSTDSGAAGIVESIEKEILTLIASATDPLIKGMLLVQLRLSQGLGINTRVTEATASELTAFRAEYQAHVAKQADAATAQAALYNKGVGGWKVMSWVMGMLAGSATIIYALTLYIFTLHLNRLDAVGAQTIDLERRTQALESRPQPRIVQFDDALRRLGVAETRISAINDAIVELRGAHLGTPARPNHAR